MDTTMDNELDKDREGSVRAALAGLVARRGRAARRDGAGHAVRRGARDGEARRREVEYRAVVEALHQPSR